MNFFLSLQFEALGAFQFKQKNALINFNAHLVKEIRF